jgi:hypothetical protein
MSRSLAQHIRNGECETPSEQEQASFFDWCQQFIDSEPLPNDAECVCNMEA